MRIFGWIIALGFFLVVAIYLIGGGVNEDVVSGLRSKKAQCQSGLASLKRVGFVTRESSSNDSGSFYVNERAWAELHYDDKIRDGLMIFCARMPDNGRYSAIIYGDKSGSVLGSVINGNWMN
jgi:hypothetical protein